MLPTGIGPDGCLGLPRHSPPLPFGKPSGHFVLSPPPQLDPLLHPVACCRRTNAVNVRNLLLSDELPVDQTLLHVIHLIKRASFMLPYSRRRLLIIIR